eukprot:jgi/Picsp_1/3616/NSC_06453-R1_tyrosyl-trna synthetase-like
MYVSVGKGIGKIQKYIGPKLGLSTYSCHSTCFKSPPSLLTRAIAGRIFPAIDTRSNSIIRQQNYASTVEQASTEGAALYARANVIETLRQRGLLQDITSPDLENLASKESLLVYCGFDPTAESLHLGNLLGIIVLSWFQRCGHRPVALLGGATGRVGDPSGKSAERPVMDEETIERNTKSIEASLRRLLQPPNSALPEPMIVNNLEWFGDMPLLVFLRDVGKMARVGTMIGKESVRKRMESESGISYTEFTYQLLQGYDFVHLSRSMGVKVQVGGSDQWGNITAGTDLARRAIDGRFEEGESSSSCFGMTFPLLLKADGSKFGKSESGALWLNSDVLSPYNFYQYLLKTTDADVIKFLKMLTFLAIDDIDKLEKSMESADYVPNTVQKKLAEEVTRFVHGDDGLQQALNATAALAPGSSTKLDANSLEAAAGDCPSASIAREDVVGKPLPDVMVQAGMQPSKAAVRRMIKGGGVRINNEKVEDEMYPVSEQDIIDERFLLIAAGKKNKMLLKIT